MLVSSEMDNVFKDGPFAGYDLPADLFIRKSFNNIKQRFVLVFQPCSN